MDIDRKLIEFAVNHIWMMTAIERGAHHDQTTIEEDMEELVSVGGMPLGWYKLKEALDASDNA